MKVMPISIIKFTSFSAFSHHLFQKKSHWIYWKIEEEQSLLKSLMDLIDPSKSHAT